MKVIHIESGLGNQMLSFAEYLVIKKLNPNDECFIENIIYDLPECSNVISQWNGYELEKIFNISVPNVKNIFTHTQWNKIIEEVRASKFWEKGWVYAPVIVKALNSQGLNLENLLGDQIKYREKVSLIKKFLNTKYGNVFKRILLKFYSKKLILKNDVSDKIFIKADNDIYTGQTLGLCVKGVNIDFIDKEIRQTFVFPAFNDKKNFDTYNTLISCNSVAIHVRRGDMLQSNGWCYKNGFFKRAVNYIRKNVENPVFFFFCDPYSAAWCKTHSSVFGININKDDIFFVDWNKGSESFRDMQLMSYCKHNIITNSSFGWWGAYLNQNPDKITCSPLVWLNTTKTF